MAEKDSSGEAGLELVIDKHSLERILKEEERIKNERLKVENEVISLIEDAKMHFTLYKSSLDEYLKKMRIKGKESDFSTIQFEKNAGSEYNYVAGRITESFRYLEEYGFIRSNQKIKAAIVDLCRDLITYYQSNSQEAPPNDLIRRNMRNAFIQFAERRQINGMLEEVTKKLKGETSVFNSKTDKHIPISEDMRSFGLGFLYFTLYLNSQNPEIPRVEPHSMLEEFVDKCRLVAITDIRRGVLHLSEVIKEYGRRMAEKGYQSVMFEVQRVVGGLKIKVVEYKKV